MMGENIIFRQLQGAEIWQHFKRLQCSKLAECQICKKVIKYDGGSTKGLHVHLKTIHEMEYRHNVTQQNVTQNNVTDRMLLI